MIKILNTPLFLGTICLSLCFTACKKDDETEEKTVVETTTPATSTATSGTTASSAIQADKVTATIGAKSFVGKSISAGKGFTTVLISCSNANDPSGDEDNLYLDMPATPTAGTHALGDNSTSDYQIRYFNTLTLNGYETKKGSGTIVIDRINIATDASGKMSDSKGTFSGWLYNSGTGKSDSLQVTNGVFEIK